MEVRQKARGTTAVNDAYTGPIGQITVDTDRDEIRLHDGSTAGGQRVLNKSQNDLLYHGIGTLTIPDITGLQTALDGKAGLADANVFTASQQMTVLTLTEHLYMADNKSVYLGDGNDLRLYHNGATSYLWNYTGSLYIRADDPGNNADVHIQSRDGGGTLRAGLMAYSNGTDAYGRVLFNGSEKLRADGSGVTVTGRLSTSSGTSSIGGSLIVGLNLDVTGAVYIGNSGGANSYIYFHDDNTNAERSFFWNDSNNRFEMEDNSNANWPVAMFSSTATASWTSFPLGQCVNCTGGSNNYTVRANAAVYNNSSVTYSTVSGTAMTGTWRNLGRIEVNGTNRFYTFQRVA